MNDPLAAARRFYSEEIQAVTGLTSPAIVEAFATVPREDFLGDGPWQVCGFDLDPRGVRYRPTPDADPRHVYHNVAIAIDKSRVLNNGQPGTIAAWIQWLEPSPGDRAIHIGTGTGYYTAILSEVVGRGGSVLGFEVDQGIAARARENLRPYANVTLVCGNASELATTADVILVNAGATHALPCWLDALADNGRILIPLTVESPGISSPVMPGKGAVLRITRKGGALAAAFGPMVAVYSCATARDPEMNAALGRALMQWKLHEVRSIRREPHTADDSCWAHKEGFCISRVDPS
jgi:protein-L-isoaspartate(D-aspartate) O-methyltransferase